VSATVAVTESPLPAARWLAQGAASGAPTPRIEELEQRIGHLDRRLERLKGQASPASR
jgi:hypothetical protein